MTIKKIFNVTKKIYKMAMAFFIIIFAFMLVIMAICAALDRSILENSSTMNMISLTVIVISLPGIVEQLLSLLGIKKKESIIEAKCPQCDNVVEFKFKGE